MLRLKKVLVILTTLARCSRWPAVEASLEVASPDEARELRALKGADRTNIS